MLGCDHYYCSKQRKTFHLTDVAISTSFADHNCADHLLLGIGFEVSTASDQRTCEGQASSTSQGIDSKGKRRWREENGRVCDGCYEKIRIIDLKLSTKMKYAFYYLCTFCIFAVIIDNFFQEIIKANYSKHRIAADI